MKKEEKAITRSHIIHNISSEYTVALLLELILYIFLGAINATIGNIFEIEEICCCFD